MSGQLAENASQGLTPVLQRLVLVAVAVQVPADVQLVQGSQLGVLIHLYCWAETGDESVKV